MGEGERKSEDRAHAQAALRDPLARAAGPTREVSRADAGAKDRKRGRMHGGVNGSGAVAGNGRHQAWATRQLLEGQHSLREKVRDCAETIELV